MGDWEPVGVGADIWRHILAHATDGWLDGLGAAAPDCAINAALDSLLRTAAATGGTVIRPSAHRADFARRYAAGVAKLMRLARVSRAFAALVPWRRVYDTMRRALMPYLDAARSILFYALRADVIDGPLLRRQVALIAAPILYYYAPKGAPLLAFHTARVDYEVLARGRGDASVSSPSPYALFQAALRHYLDASARPRSGGGGALDDTYLPYIFIYGTERYYGLVSQHCQLRVEFVADHLERLHARGTLDLFRAAMVPADWDCPSVIRDLPLGRGGDGRARPLYIPDALATYLMDYAYNPDTDVQLCRIAGIHQPRGPTGATDDDPATRYHSEYTRVPVDGEHPPMGEIRAAVARDMARLTAYQEAVRDADILCRLYPVTVDTAQVPVVAGEDRMTLDT